MSDDSKQIRILAVDDHPLSRQGFASLIAEELNMTPVQKPRTAARRSSHSMSALSLAVSF